MPTNRPHLQHEDERDRELMLSALAVAQTARAFTAPNPWVGAAIRTNDGTVHTGATSPPGGPHAEVVALGKAGSHARGATLATTLEPCSHHGRTGPCVDAIIDAGVRRVVIGVIDPDPHVSGTGIAALRTAGIDVTTGVCSDEVTAQLEPYLVHRSTGRPFVVAKLAATLDGRTAAPDGTSQWITGEAARTDAHQLRAESDAIVVGAGTVRVDDPALTTRLVDGPDPLRVVLGGAPPGARVHPCREWSGDLGELLDTLGADGVLQVMVEGGATTLNRFAAESLVDRYVIYLAPALFGGGDALGMFAGQGSPTMDALTRGSFVSVRQVGEDIRVEFRPNRAMR